MFTSCPHCRELVAIDHATRLAPEMCPRCGGTLRNSPVTESVTTDSAGTRERSFVSFLQAGEPAEAGTTETTTIAGTESIEEATIADPILPEDANVEIAATGIDTVIDSDSDSTSMSTSNSRMEMEAEIISEATPGLDAEIVDAAHDDAIAAAEAPTPVVSTPIPQAFPATPSFTRQNAGPVSHPPAAGWQWALLVALSLTLVVQVLLADRVRLAADATWRPLLAPLCEVLGCSIPPWHQPDALTMLSRDVSPIAGRAGSLNVQATFRNDARWAQAWPVLLLSLSDADGRVLGSRAFTPREYLGTAATQTELAPGQSAHIGLQLHEPDPNVVAFTFDFR